jgi:2-hydroxychromene-2-carboxylate isomerase
MTLSFDLYWSFRSPYSYLAMGRLADLRSEYDVDINLKIVGPLAIRDAQFFERTDPRFMSYLFGDVVRIVQMEKIPFSMPKPDPIVQDVATRKIAADQPYIFRLLRLGVLATERDKGFEFIFEISRIIWGGVVPSWNEGDAMKEAATRAGLDLAEMDAAIEADPARFDAIVEANEREQKETGGHWGVPLMQYGREAFFGQDRIAALIWRLEQDGLTKR